MNAMLRMQVESVKMLVSGRETTDGPRLLGEYARSLREALAEVEALEREQRLAFDAAIARDLGR